MNCHGTLMLAAACLVISAAPLENVMAAGVPDSLRLGTVEQRLLDNNADIAAARRMESAAFLQAKGVGRWDDPMLMFGVTNLPTSFDFREDMMTMTMIGFSQSLPLFGQKSAQRTAADLAAQSSTWQRRIMERDMLAMARQTFVDAYIAQRREELQKEQLALAEQIAGAARSLVVTNRADQSDLLAAKAQVHREQIALVQASQVTATRRRNLAALLGDSVIAAPLAYPQLAFVPPSVEVWQHAVLVNDPALALRSAEAERFAAQANAERAMGRPMLALSGSYGFRKDSEMEKRDNMVGAQLSISLPLFSRGASRNMATAMQTMRLQAEDERAQLLRNTTARIADLHSRAIVLDSSRTRYRTEILPLTEEAFRSSLSGYAAGRTSLTRLLDDAGAIIKDYQALLDLEREYCLTVIEAERYIAPDLPRVSTNPATGTNR